MFNLTWLVQLVRKNILAPLNAFMEASAFDRSLYLQDSLKYFGGYGSMIYGLPFMYSPQILYYRKDLFLESQLSEQYKQRYNVSLRPPKTWKEFHNITEFFSRSRTPEAPTRYGTCIPAAYVSCLVPDFYTRLSFYNAAIWDEQDQIRFSSKNLRQAYFDFLADLKIDAEHYQTSNYVDAARSFINGDTAMIITYPSFTTDMIDIGKSKIAGRIGYAHIPGKSTILYGQSFGISAHSGKKEYAWQFTQWLCGKGMAEFITLLSGQTVMADILENDYILTLYPWLKLFKETWQHTRDFKPPYNAKTAIYRGDIDMIIGKNMYALLREQISPEDAVMRTSEELRILFEQNGFRQYRR